MTGRRIVLSSALLLFLFSGFSSRADDPALGRVGGIDIAEGEVTIRLPGGGEAAGTPLPGAWAEAGRNDPVAAGMAVRTAAASRAVLRVGADLVAFSETAEADIVKLDRAGTALALHGGRLGVFLSGHEAGRVTEIAIPNGAVRLFAPGEYEIAAGDGRFPARLAVFAGTARVVGKGLDAVVTSGGTALLIGEERLAMLPGGASEEEDAFAEWWRAQKRSPADSPALHRVSAALTGHERLDQHGAWERIAGIGEAWFPKDPPRDWAPYRHGRWRWMNPWGWTWIDDLPWGFATSHYGRWVHVGEADSGTGRWGWVPGERVAEPVFMPAAVAFLGTAGVGLSYPDAFRPAVAWFPLAPGEVYWPDFTDDPAAIRRLNEGIGADPSLLAPTRKGDPPADIVTGDYSNRRHASVVPRAVFIGGRPVAEALIELPAHRLENAPLLAGSPGIEPPRPRPPARTPSEAPSAAVPAQAERARDTLAGIGRSRETRQGAAAPAVSQRPAPRTVTAGKRAAQPQAAARRTPQTARPSQTVRANQRARSSQTVRSNQTVRGDQRARGNRTATQARPAPASQTRSRSAASGGKPATSRAAGLRSAESGG
jgi:hypothetical protein